jgi:hypothetical protein
MFLTGLFGEGLFGGEYFSARVVEGSEATPVVATSSWLMDAATRLRTGVMSISALATVLISKACVILPLWRPGKPVTPTTWTSGTPAPDPWSISGRVSPTWSSSPAPGADPWVQTDPGRRPNWTKT